MDIEKTIDHEKFDLVDIKDLRSIPHRWEETQLDFIRSSDSITDNYKYLINLFSDAIDQIVACYCRYRDGKTSDFSNRIDRVIGLFKTQDPYLLNWLNAESVRGNDHSKYLEYLSHNFELVFTHIGIDLTETGIPSIINEYLKLDSALKDGDSSKKANEKPDILAICYLILKFSKGERVPMMPNGINYRKSQIEREMTEMIEKFGINYRNRPRTIYNHIFDLDINNTKMLNGINSNWPNEVARILKNDQDVISFCNEKYNLSL